MVDAGDVTDVVGVVDVADVVGVVGVVGVADVVGVVGVAGAADVEGTGDRHVKVCGESVSTSYGGCGGGRWVVVRGNG